MTHYAFAANVPVKGLRNGCRTKVGSSTEACPLIMRKDKPKSSKSKKPRQQPPYESKGEPLSRQSAEEMLLKDLEAMRAKQKTVDKVDKSSALLGGVKTVIDTVLLWDFFLVVGLLLWLAVALVPHFASKNDVLLDPWLGLWQPFIQPVLGVLMLGTVIQGTISYLNSE